MFIGVSVHRLSFFCITLLHIDGFALDYLKPMTPSFNSDTKKVSDLQLTTLAAKADIEELMMICSISEVYLKNIRWLSIENYVPNNWKSFVYTVA